jgi:AraC family transcriptional activator of pobA
MEQAPFEIFSLAAIPQDKITKAAGRHHQTHFEIIWIQDGSGYHKVDDLQCPLTAGSIYCAAPGQDHQLVIAPETRGYILSFTDTFLWQEMDEHNALYDASLKRLMRRHPEVRVNEDSSEDMIDILLLMLKETQRSSLQRAEILVKYLKIFMISFRRQLEAACPIPQQKTKNDLANAFFSLLETHFKEEKMVAHYAGKLFITPNHLNQIVKMATGYPTKYHIQQRLLYEAKRVVYYKSASLKEIAYDLGFTDSSHFSKFFKNTCGVNFSVFKKHNLNVI